MKNYILWFTEPIIKLQNLNAITVSWNWCIDMKIISPEIAQKCLPKHHP